MNIFSLCSKPTTVYGLHRFHITFSCWCLIHGRFILHICAILGKDSLHHLIGRILIISKKQDTSFGVGMFGSDLHLQFGVPACFFDSGNGGQGNISWAVETPTGAPLSTFTVSGGYSYFPSLCTDQDTTAVLTVPSSATGSSIGSIQFQKPDLKAFAVVRVECQSDECVLGFLLGIENI